MTLHSSQMGRGGHRDDRRRRLLAEDLTANASLPAQAASAPPPRNGQPPAHRSGNYGDAEFLQTQRRLTDLIPRRVISYILFLKVGLAAIAGLLVLYLWIPDLLRSQYRPAMVDLGKCGSLGNWFASLLLLAAAMLALIVYSVRRHKVDDYRGRYHVWLWAAAWWFTMATGLAANVHLALQQLMIALTGARITGDGSIWWIAPAVLFGGTTCIRLLIDMRASRLSSAALILAGAAYLTAIVVALHGIKLQSEVYEFLLQQGALLAGPLLAAMSMGLHARYVVLDAEGALPKRSPKIKAKKQKRDRKHAGTAVDAARGGEKEKGSQGADGDKADEDSDDEASGDAWVAVDPPHAGAQPVLKRVASGGAPAASPLGQRVASLASASPDPDSNSDGGKLSKADRKALKKKLLEERIEREQRKSSNW
jgi:hypothetical protein